VKVAVVGAGIGGLCLAQGLRRNGIDVTVYERDDTLSSRGQGYRVHLDAGRALYECLPPDLYELCVSTSGRPSTRMTVVRGNLRVLRKIEFPAPSDPFDPDTLSTSVNRQTLREVLAARLDGDLEFGRACTGFEQQPDTVRLAFADGSSAQADVLVAADGIGSPIRGQYLPHAQLADTGMVSIVGRTPLTEQTRSLIPAYTWQGFTAVAGPRLGMATGVLDFREPPGPAAARIAPDVRLSAAPGYLMWALTGRARKFAGPLEDADPARLHAVAVDSIRRWHPDLRQLLALADVQETIRIAIRTSIPIDPWPATRVTLLGDAIHAMSPSRGSGANTALRDAALLTKELATAARGDKPVVQAIADYEQQMRDYGFAAVRSSVSAEAGRRGWPRVGFLGVVGFGQGRSST
jgi:2-polyprenyl-6-methoxyphenol hydroxylase-like FAD-dependent oxidoreductase